MKKTIKNIISTISLLCLFSLMMPATVSDIIRYTIVFVVIGIGILIFMKKYQTEKRKIVYKELIVPNLLIVSGLAIQFFYRWQPSNSVAHIASLIYCPINIFLLLISFTLGLFSIIGVNQILQCGGAICNILLKDCKWNKPTIERIVKFIIIAFFAFGEYFQMSYSSVGEYSFLYTPTILQTAINILLFAVINLFIVLILQKWKRTLLFSGIVFTLWSIVNVYVVLYHGSPLFLSEFVNLTTAIGVVGSYSFQIDPCIGVIIIVFGLELWLLNVFPIEENHKKPLKICFIRFGIFLFFCFVVLTNYYPVFGASWKYSIINRGFSLCLIDDAYRTLNPIKKPNNYDSKRIASVSLEQNKELEEYPDLILILNETFCDLDYYSFINADSNYLGDFYSVENASFGYAVIPGVGGGTNNSEYELLTSKSTALINSAAPFYFIDFKKSPSSIVQYLKQLGYYTSALHSGEKNSYARDKAYPSMGFDSVIMGKDNFTNSKNGNRPQTDLSEYQDMINYYNERVGTPQFVYLLTYQNHGGYEQNDDSLDTVHTMKDFGNLTDDVNEYLSSLKLSAEAFKYLTDYFSSIDRSVIICMVGDHAPSFIEQLPAKKEMTENEKQIAQRVVPYVVWSNYGADHSVCPKYASMVDLMPILIKTTGLPMSPFYQTLLNINEEIPIRTATGLLMDNNDEISVLDDNSQYFELMEQYYFMEYNSLIGGEEYKEELFIPTIK